MRLMVAKKFPETAFRQRRGHAAEAQCLGHHEEHDKATIGVERGQSLRLGLRDAGCHRDGPINTSDDEEAKEKFVVGVSPAYLHLLTLAKQKVNVRACTLREGGVRFQPVPLPLRVTAGYALAPGAIPGVAVPTFRLDFGDVVFL